MIGFYLSTMSIFDARSKIKTIEIPQNAMCSYYRTKPLFDRIFEMKFCEEEERLSIHGSYLYETNIGPDLLTARPPCWLRRNVVTTSSLKKSDGEDPMDVDDCALIGVD